MASAAASRYAKALVDVATAPGAKIEPRQMIAQLRDFESALSSATELRHILLILFLRRKGNRDNVGRAKCPNVQLDTTRHEGAIELAGSCP